MKKVLRSLVAVMACVIVLSACSDNNEPGATGAVGTNSWSVNGGNAVKIGSVLAYEAGDNVNVLFASKSGLTTVADFNEVDDYTEISFPVDAIGTDIDLTQLYNDEEGTTYILSRLPEFGEKYGLLIDGSTQVVWEGKLSSSLEGGRLSVQCEFTTIGTNINFKTNLSTPFSLSGASQPDANFCDYTVTSRNISESAIFRTGFYYKNSWNAGWTFTYSVSGIDSYIQLGNNAYVEIYVGSDKLLNGEPFDVAHTNLPFSFTLEYLDRNQQATIPVTISNTNRSGASGYVTLTRNAMGLYDAQFDLTLNDGDITLSGAYAGQLNPRNTVYTGDKGTVATLHSATLDISGDPCVLYLSSKSGEAGPKQYDIKCEVPADEWRYGKFMAFSGQGSSVIWIDGVLYNKASAATTSVFGGNWRVMQPQTLDGAQVAECQVTLYGSHNAFAYYYGELKVIE